MTTEPGVARLLERGVAERPQRNAVVDRGCSFTYAALEQQVARLAAAMQAAALAGERVALMLPNGIEILCCYLACFRAGAIAAPINYRYAPPELARALARGRPRWLVIHAARLGVLAEVPPAQRAGCRVLVVGGEAPLPPGCEPFETLPLPAQGLPAQALAADRPAVMFLTSGSTGQPKGVLHSQGSARAMVDSTAAAFGGTGAGDVILLAEPQVHVSGFIGSLAVLAGGGTVVLRDGFAEASYVEDLRRWRPTLICTHIDLLMKLARWPDIRRADFASLRGVFTGGDRVPAAWQREFADATGLPIQLGWGMTEAIWLTLSRTPRLDREGCIGQPIAGVALRVTDLEGRDLPEGEVGELRVRGPMVMLRYWDDPAETARVLEDGWLRTGDSGWRDAEGVWWFAARLKELIVRNTSKITPGEVEAALTAHPAVAAAGVVGVPDPAEGEVPIAYVVPAAGAAPTEAALLEFLRRRIALYKLPVRIRMLVALPLTPSGKVDHAALKAMAASAG